MRRAVLAIAILTVLGAGIWIWASGLGGEQQFRYGVSNDSRRAKLNDVGWEDLPSNRLEPTGRCEA